MNQRHTDCSKTRAAAVHAFFVLMLLAAFLAFTTCAAKEEGYSSNRYGSTEAPDYIFHGTTITEDALSMCSQLYQSDGDISDCIDEWVAHTLVSL